MALVPKHIKKLSPYTAGKPIDELKRELGQEIRIFFKTPNLYSSKLDISDKLDHTAFLIKNIFNY